MGSQGGGGGGGGTPDPKSHSLARQGSLYSLTLDEVQNQLGDLGKPLSSMNLDELLKNVWSAEANQGTTGLDYAGGGQHNHGQQLASASSLNRQSSLTLSRDLSKKTVDEVWKDIQQGHNQNNLDRKAQEKRRSTLGEMTLEDFLVKAGVVSESSPVNKNSGPVLGVDPIQNVSHQQAQWMHYQQQSMLPVYMPGHQVQQPLPISANPIMDVTYPETQITISPSSLMGTLSDIQTPGRKRVAPGEVVEKIVERRQKRMIKNRESAARSRARKQAYTHELENKISRLEEENERLKRQKEEEKLLACVPPPEPKYQLRRTSSASF